METPELHMGSSPHSRAGVINPNETTPWLRHTRWPDLFRNRSLEVISTTAQQPDFVQGQDYLLGKWKESSVESSAEAEAQLRILLHGVDIMFNCVMATMARTSYTSRCWLNTYSRNDFWPHPFRAVLCLKRYISVWKRLICFVFRVLGFKERQRQQLYNFKLGLKEEKMMHYILFLASQLPSREQGHSRRQPVEDDVLSQASSDESDGETDFEEDASIGIDDSSQYQSEFLLPSRPWLELSEALFQLSMMFWTHQDPAGDMSSSVIIYYTAVMGIQRRSMSYYPAHNSTGGLAALMWVGRALFLEYALPLYSYTTLAYHWSSRDQYHSQPERLEAIRQRYLVRGCYTPFGELIELKAFAKSIVRLEGMPGNLSWAPDGRSFVVGNDKEVKLSDFCKTYHKAIALVEEQVEEMMLGLEPNFNVDVVRDDLNCRKAGWSFLQKPENKLSDAREMLINKLRTSQFRGKPFATASHWCPDTCLAYLNLGLDLNKSAFAALQISGGLPGRGSEASGILKYLTRDLVTPWTLFLYRQASLAISKRYISKLVEKRNYYYPTSADDPIRMFAAGAGHHPRMLLTAYAIDKALPSRLQPELLEMYYRLSTMWQDWNVQYYRDNCQAQDKEPCKSLNVTLHTWKRASSPESPERAPKRVKTALGGENTNDLSDGVVLQLPVPDSNMHHMRFDGSARDQAVIQPLEHYPPDHRRSLQDIDRKVQPV
ncbi:hypothetical protein FOXG_19373 [Fusarium oxysporum f. sp. lycopersici 4287]|uniref:Uncharacterized protein n=1 Tax=Fusarium oxysporum f. sp. lycopersici (strain 4287 / CBS 123668 / FGSC 9935 / NRRL 34936) TaxID=426428 RepID=A0A0J9V0M5_FUSO4|nr:hypothetical protein FOXG_19373 [Fusarium oxysporum f. sp. lycopersici 4287]KNB04693.1 hypothetical protein FOXG_19373 [Fusarium oxysporum f. sp. lycopersici 4287]